MPSVAMTLAGTPVARSAGGRGPCGRRFRDEKRRAAEESIRARRAVAAARKRAAEAGRRIDPIEASLPPVADPGPRRDERYESILSELKPKGAHGARVARARVLDSLVSEFQVSRSIAAVHADRHLKGHTVAAPKRRPTPLPLAA